MTPVIAFIENNRRFYELAGLPFGAKQEETYERVYFEKRNCPRGKATRFLLAEEIKGFLGFLKNQKGEN